MNRRITLDDLPKLASELAGLLCPPKVVYLCGDLGTGKTTLVRALLADLGCRQAVTSPTYSLHETYQIDKLIVHHFDLYRIDSADELEFLGIRDNIDEQSVLLFEWPERATQGSGRSALPPADINVRFQYVPEDADARFIEWSVAE